MWLCLNLALLTLHFYIQGTTRLRHVIKGLVADLSKWILRTLFSKLGVGLKGCQVLGTFKGNWNLLTTLGTTEENVFSVCCAGGKLTDAALAVSVAAAQNQRGHSPGLDVILHAQAAFLCGSSHALHLLS